MFATACWEKQSFDCRCRTISCICHRAAERLPALAISLWALNNSSDHFGGFDLSAIVFVSFPTGASGVSRGGYDPGLQLPWSYKVSAKWTAGGQVAFYWPTLAQQHNFTGETAFFLDRQFGKPWDAFMEYAGDFPDRGGSRQVLHFGTAYKLTPHQQIDFHVAVGISGAAAKNYIGIGYSVLFLPR